MSDIGKITGTKPVWPGTRDKRTPLPGNQREREKDKGGATDDQKGKRDDHSGHVDEYV